MPHQMVGEEGGGVLGGLVDARDVYAQYAAVVGIHTVCALDIHTYNCIAL